MTNKRAVSKMCKDGYINLYTNYDENGKLIRLDYEGNVIERPESDHPYSYSTHCTWAILGNARKKIDKMEITNLSGIYSDRLFTSDALKYNMACREVWGNEGQYFDSRTPKDIEKMLQIIYENPKLKLYRILKSCNASSGYPVWYFAWYNQE